MADRPKILVTQEVPEAAYPLLEAVGDVEANRGEGVIWSSEELLKRAPGHDYLYCLVTNTIDAHLLEACAAATPRLKLVANMAVGYNNIDVAAATRLHIAVSNTPGVLSDTTADLTFALLMATARRLPESERFLRAGKFTGWSPLAFCGTDVHHATLGIIGMGRIGKLVAKRASGFDMQVLYHNTHRLPVEEEQRYNATYVSQEDLLRRADFVCLLAPYTSATHHLIGEQELQMMKPDSFLINSARGPMVDEKALLHALQKGTIAGAGLDVFENEPAVEPELLNMENVVLLPHIGSGSWQTRTRMATMASQNIVAHATGQRPPNLVNPEALQ